MAETNSFQAVCSGCGEKHTLKVVNSVNVKTSPELKEKIVDGELFTWTCPACGRTNLSKYPFLYHDPDEKLMLLLTDAPLRSEGLPEGYTGRIVRSVGELIEKIKIFDSGLDDIVIEMCKFVTIKELKKNVQLRFLKIDGADSEMTFTYPENSQMQMIAVGFNVYEDCAAIVQRNPSVRESVSGLASVDKAWLETFMA